MSNGITWKDSLFNCTTDIKSCLIVAFIPGGICCIQAVAVDKATREGRCIPFLFVCFLGCYGGAINRGTIRRRYNIPGGYCGDLCTWHFCPECAACQEYRTASQY